MLPVVIFLVLHVLLQAIPLAAYSWKFNANPAQCSDLSITVTGTGGKPPYNVLVVPFGSSPLPNQVDVRGIVQKTFDGNSNSVTVPINYPANSQFVAVVSDSSGFGTGGTTGPTTVADSGDNSCFNPSHAWTPQFWFYIGPPSNVVAQCTTTRIYWNHSAVVEGTANFVSVIPGGTSFQIPEASPTTTSDGIGFSWLPQIREGTHILIVGGDDRGMGAGGLSPELIVAHSDISSCVSTSSTTSTTPGTVAGTDKTSRAITPIISGAVGGSIGFIALSVLAAFFFIRRRRGHGATRATVTSTVSSIYATRPSNGVSHYGPEPFSYQRPPSFAFSPANSTTSDTASAHTRMASTSDGRISTGTQQFEATSSFSRSTRSMTSQSSPQVTSTATIQRQRVDSENAPASSNLPPAYNTLAGVQQDSRRQQYKARKGKLIELRPPPP